MKKILQIANGIALIATIIINYLSNTGVFNGNTMKTVSDKYHNYFTPASYAFAIWGVIYLGLSGFVIYTGRSLFKKTRSDGENVVEEMGWWFVISCVANSLWVIAWLYDATGISVILMSVLLISLLKIIINTRMELDFHPLKKYLLIFWPFAFYSGWITVAIIADVAAWLTKINWTGWGIPPVSWTIIMIIIACLINVVMILKRNLREYALVGIWALIAIAVSNQNEVHSIVIVSYVAAAVIFLFIILSSRKAGKGRSLGNM